MNIEYCQIKKIVAVRAYTTATIRQASKCGYAVHGYLTEAREEEDVQGTLGNEHSRKIYRRCESAGVVFVDWRVIRVGGKVSSPNAPAGVV